jgi:hypothetical protein
MNNNMTTKKLLDTNRNTDEKISSVNYGDIYRQNMTSLFPLLFTEKIVFIGEYQGNYRWKSRNKEKLDRYSLVISVEKYDVSIL